MRRTPPPRRLETTDIRDTLRRQFIESYFDSIEDELKWTLKRYDRLCGALALTRYELAACFRCSISDVNWWVRKNQIPRPVELHLTYLERAIFRRKSTTPPLPSAATMHDYDILAAFGSTPQRIREVCTATGGADLTIRKRLEDRIEARIHEGTRLNLANYTFFAAADLAWDSNVISKILVPLQLYAQGRVQLEAVLPELKKLPEDVRKDILKVDKETKKETVDIPEFFKVAFNLVRALITRRTAAIAANYAGNFPFYKYEARSTAQVAKLRADVLSQRIEMMTDQYGYRHGLVQAIREMLLYPFSCEFVAGAWDVERTFVKAPISEDLKDTEGRPADGKLRVVDRITREGVAFNRPHPSRVIWNIAHPLASLNTDTGVDWIGYWNVIPYRELRRNTAFFNREQIEYNYQFATMLNGVKNYWELYFSTAAVKFPDRSDFFGVDPAGDNDRAKQFGRYTLQEEDKSVFLVEYFERLIPKDEGLGEYPFPIWVRFVVGGGSTIVYGEFLPDTPGVVYQYNNHDGRVLNNSWAMDIVPFQDQLTNMLTHFLHSQKASSIKGVSVNLDLVTDKKILTALRNQVTSDDIYKRPFYIEYKGSALADVGMKPTEVVQVTETTAMNDVTMYIRSMAQLISMAERLLGVSANESAQSEPREVSATESANIATTVNTTLNFMGFGVDEAIDAKKRILYKGLLSKGSKTIKVPVANRYRPQTIKDAGFNYEEESKDGTSGSNLADVKRFTVIGTVDKLEYEYTFTSRDGSERAVNAKGAETLVNLLAQLAQLPQVLQELDKEQLYMLLNEIIRLSGAAIDVRFGVKDGEGQQLPAGDAVTDNKKQVDTAINQLAQAIMADRQSIQQIQAMLAQVTGAPIPAAPADPTAAPAAPAAPAPAADPSIAAAAVGQSMPA